MQIMEIQAMKERAGLGWISGKVKLFDRSIKTKTTFLIWLNTVIHIRKSSFQRNLLIKAFILFIRFFEASNQIMFSTTDYELHFILPSFKYFCHSISSKKVIKTERLLMNFVNF